MPKSLNKRALLVAVVALPAFAPTIASAQAYQCRAPAVSRVPAITPDAKPRPKSVTGPTTGYTLALSWSPEFCKPRETSPGHRVQCSGDYGRFGMIVHGLWPQGQRTWPQWCKQQNRLTPAQVRKAMCMMPSARLIARQWAKHGSCMTKKPETYFGVTRVLWESLAIPEYDRIAYEDDLTAGRIRAAFAEANPGISASAVGVKLNARGWLKELRVCYSERFRPTRCKDREYGARDAAQAKIWRGL